MVPAVQELLQSASPESSTRRQHASGGAELDSDFSSNECYKFLHLTSNTIPTSE
jgi:hypothetical protein